MNKYTNIYSNLGHPARRWDGYLLQNGDSEKITKEEKKKELVYLYGKLPLHVITLITKSSSDVIFPRVISIGILRNWGRGELAISQELGLQFCSIYFSSRVPSS